MTTASYFHGRLNLHRTVAVEGYFERLTFSLETMALTMKIWFGPLLRNYKWQLLQIFTISGHNN